MSDVIGLEVSALRIGAPVVPARASLEPHRDCRSYLHTTIRDLWFDVAAMGELVENAVVCAVTALRTVDVDQASTVIAGDAQVNAMQQHVREACHRVLMTQQPLCSDLRDVLAAVQMCGELERMGDHCVSIAKEARALAGLPSAEAPEILGTLGVLCARQVRDVCGAVVRRDVDAARAVAARDDEVDTAYHSLVDTLVRDIPRDPGAAIRLTTLLLAAHHLERIGDRVTNIAEELMFAVTGEHTDLG